MIAANPRRSRRLIRGGLVPTVCRGSLMSRSPPSAGWWQQTERLTAASGPPERSCNVVDLSAVDRARARATGTGFLVRLPVCPSEPMVPPMRIAARLAPPTSPGSQVTGETRLCQSRNTLLPGPRRWRGTPDWTDGCCAGPSESWRTRCEGANRLQPGYRQVASMGSTLTVGSKDFSRVLRSACSGDEARLCHSCGSVRWS